MTIKLSGVIWGPAWVPAAAEFCRVRLTHDAPYGTTCSDITMTSSSLLVTTTEERAMCLHHTVMNLSREKCKLLTLMLRTVCWLWHVQRVCVAVFPLVLISDIKQEPVPQVITAWCAELCQAGVSVPVHGRCFLKQAQQGSRLPHTHYSPPKMTMTP